MEAYTAHIFFYHGATVTSGPEPHFRAFAITPHSVGLLWTSDQSVAETPAWQHTALTRDRFEPAIPASEQTHTHALNRAAAGFGFSSYTSIKYCLSCSKISRY